MYSRAIRTFIHSNLIRTRTVLTYCIVYPYYVCLIIIQFFVIQMYVMYRRNVYLVFNEFVDDTLVAALLLEPLHDVIIAPLVQRFRSRCSRTTSNEGGFLWHHHKLFTLRNSRVWVSRKGKKEHPSNRWRIEIWLES